MVGPTQQPSQVLSHSHSSVDKGIVYTWGLGEFGALGTGDTFTRYAPTHVESMMSNNIVVASVACGCKHTAFVSSMKATATFE